MKSIEWAINFYLWLKAIFDSTFQLWQDWIYFYLKDENFMFNAAKYKLFKEYKTSQANKYYRNAIVKYIINDIRTKIFWLQPLNFKMWFQIWGVWYNPENENIKADVWELEDPEKLENDNQDKEILEDTNLDDNQAQQEKRISTIQDKLKEYKEKWSLYHKLLYLLLVRKEKIRNLKFEDLQKNKNI